MKIVLRKGKPAPPEAILALERALECRLSDSFRTFLQTNDGAEPEENVFKIGQDRDCGVTEFIPVRSILKERKLIENIPEKGYPVARTDFGNYLFVDEDESGAVFFWDHEEPYEPAKLAADFRAFLDLLEPFDLKTIRLKPGQVTRVLIRDPDLLKKLKQAEEKENEEE